MPFPSLNSWKDSESFFQGLKETLPVPHTPSACTPIFEGLSRLLSMHHENLKSIMIKLNCGFCSLSRLKLLTDYSLWNTHGWVIDPERIELDLLDWSINLTSLHQMSTCTDQPSLNCIWLHNVSACSLVVNLHKLYTTGLLHLKLLCQNPSSQSHPGLTAVGNPCCKLKKVLGERSEWLLFLFFFHTSETRCECDTSLSECLFMCLRRQQLPKSISLKTKRIWTA